MRHLQHRPLVAPLSFELLQEGQETTLPATPVAVLERVQERAGNRGICQGLAGAAGFDGAAAETLSRALAGIDDAEWLRGGNQAALARLRTGGGAPLPAAVAQRMEAAFGHDFSAVRIHTGAEAAQQSEALSARAFAMGDHVFFGRGAWAPGTPAGDRVLVHELTHVVQHHEGRLPKSGGVSSPTDPHEREAVAAEDALLARLDGLLAEGGGVWAAQGEALPETEAAGPTEGADLSRSAEEAPAEAAPAEGEQKEEGEDAGMLIELVRMVSPELADLMEMGMPALLDMLRAEIEQQVEAMWSGVEGMDFFAQLSAPLGESADALASGAAADPNCCEALPAWLSSLRRMAELWSQGGTFEQMAKLGSKVGNSAFSIFGFLVEASPVTMLLKLIGPSASEVLEIISIGLDKLAWMDQAQALSVGKMLGVDATGMSTLGLAGVIAEMMLGAAHSMISKPMRLVFEALATLPVVEEIYPIIDRMAEFSSQVSWLWEHIDDPDLFETAGAEMGGTWIPAFLEQGKLLKPTLNGAWEGTFNGLTGLLACLAAAAAAAAGQKELYGLAVGLNKVRSAINDALQEWKNLFEKHQGLLEELDVLLLNLMPPLAGTLLLINAGQDALTTIINLLFGSEIGLLPECYAATLFDIALDMLLAVGGSLIVPFLSTLPGAPATIDLAWQALNAGVQFAKDLPAADKQTFLVRVVEMATADFGISYLAGVAWGISGAIASSVGEAVELAYALIQVPFDIAAFIPEAAIDLLTFFISTTTPADGAEDDKGIIGSVDDLGDAMYLQDEYSRKETDPAAAAAEKKKHYDAVHARIRAGQPPATGLLSLSSDFFEALGKTVTSLPALIAMIGDAWPLIEATFADLGAKAMQAGLEAFFHNTGERSSFEMGEMVGELVGGTFGELVLVCGAGGLLKVAPRVSAALRSILGVLKAPEKVLETLMTPVAMLFDVLGLWLDDLLVFMAKSNLKALAPVAAKIKELMVAWKGFMDELKKCLGVADEAPNAKTPDAKTPDAKDANKKEGDAPATDGSDTQTPATPETDTKKEEKLTPEQAAEKSKAAKAEKIKAFHDAARSITAEDLKKISADVMSEIDTNIAKGVSLDDINKVVKDKYKKVVDELSGAADVPGWLDPSKSPRDNILDEVKKRTKEELENQAKESAGQAEAEEKKEEEKKEEAPKTEGRPVEADEETHTLGHTCHREEEADKKD